MCDLCPSMTNANLRDGDGAGVATYIDAMV